MSRLFRPPRRFEGLPIDGFRVFSIPDREERRRAIVETFHPGLEALGDDLIELLAPRVDAPLHAHLPRLDWPPGYRPFCTWLALSHASHGYQGEAQLNVGVHAGHVAIRLGWDTQADGFGRFEFLSRHGGLGEEMVALAAEHSLDFRVYAAAAWPEGSRRVFESRADWRGAFDEVKRRGVWFELGLRRDLPAARSWAASPALEEDAARVFEALLPAFERVTGHAPHDGEGDTA